MNSQINKWLLAFTVIGLLSACKKDKPDPGVDFTIVVSYPETYKDSKASDALVVIKNSFTGVESNDNTDADGSVTFTSILPGTYQITVTRELTAAEALVQTGIEAEAYLSASVADQQVTTAGGSLELRLAGSAVGGFVIKQVYYTGAKNTTNYSNDQFLEIYNNSTETLYADSLCFGDVHGSPTTASPFKTDTEHVYFYNLFMIPGDGTSHPVAPGESIVIARTAINHKSDAVNGNPNSPVDLGKGVADFEVYWETAGRDVDNPDVPNAEIIHYRLATLIDWFPSVVGASYVIFKHPDPTSLPKFQEPGSSASTVYPRVPVEYVIDGVDFVRNADLIATKRLPSFIDAGYVFCSNSYSSEAPRRKVKTTVNGRRILQDTNNTSNDFEIVTPTPKGW